MPYLAEPERYESMTYQRCGRSGLRLPALSLGLWHNFGDDRPFETGRAICTRPALAKRSITRRSEIWVLNVAGLPFFVSSAQHRTGVARTS